VALNLQNGIAGDIWIMGWLPPMRAGRPILLPIPLQEAMQLQRTLSEKQLIGTQLLYGVPFFRS
jgi:hypothetical protein